MHSKGEHIINQYFRRMNYHHHALLIKAGELIFSLLLKSGVRHLSSVNGYVGEGLILMRIQHSRVNVRHSLLFEVDVYTVRP